MKNHAVFFLVFGLTTATHLAHAQDLQLSPCSIFQGEGGLDPRNPQDMPLPVVLHYRQTRRLGHDVLGDVSLARYALHAPYGLYWTLTKQHQVFADFTKWIMSGKACGLEVFNIPDRRQPQYAMDYTREIPDKETLLIKRLNVPARIRDVLLNRLRRGNLYLSGRRLSIREDAFVQMFNQVVAEEARETVIRPTEGTIPGWSQEILSSKDPFTLGVVQFPKLLVALSLGESSRYLVSGQEVELTNWILAGRYRSIEPADLLRASYRLNRGDVAMTLLTIENVLSRFWRDTNRANLDQTVRLVPIVNHFGGDGEVFGSWYHFFGMVLFGYTENALTGRLVGEIETLGSLVLNGFRDERGEDLVNRQGASVGARIRKAVREGQWRKSFSSLDYSRIDAYLDLNEDFSGRLREIANSTK